MKQWYKIESKADKAEIWLYEFIGEDFWTGEGVTAKKFQKEIAAIKASQIDLHINSPGGSVFDGITIYNLIKQHSANVTTYIDGLAASIASVIALAGNQVLMAENALWMMHNPSGVVYGQASDMRSMADVLDKVTGSMLMAYSGKSGKTDDEIKALLDGETWMNADEAMEAGFIDEIVGELDVAARAKFIPVMAKLGFKNIPGNIAASKDAPTEREIERALRDAGCSAKQAKTILARGYLGDLRDEGNQDDSPAASTQRDVEPAPAPKRDRVSDLLVRAELVAPSN